MGWDAYASPLGYADPGHPAFVDAMDRVIRDTGYADGGLQNNMLDITRCGKVLEAVARRSMYSLDPWPPEFVQALDANEEEWRRVGRIETDEWAPHHFRSAREFVRVCASLNQGIYFSW